MAEAAEKVADDEGCQDVEVEDLAHEKEVYVRHLDRAIVLLGIEVDSLGPDENNEVEDEQRQQDVLVAEHFLQSTKSHGAENHSRNVQGEPHPNDYLHADTLLVDDRLLLVLVVEDAHTQPGHHTLTRQADQVQH